MRCTKLMRRALVASLVFLVPAVSAAQQPAPEQQWWIIGGAGSTTFLGDCTNCEITNYRHTASILAGGGYIVNPRVDLGGEVLWVPTTTSTTGEKIRTTFVTAVVQFRPWREGFFVKASSGMGFVRNWVVEIEGEPPPFISKAFTVGIGAGWEFRATDRFHVQLFGIQHALAFGDLQTNESTVENVMGNFWSFGVAMVLK
jgi:hypothetical protein